MTERDDIPLARVNPEMRSRVWKARSQEEATQILIRISETLIQEGKRPLSQQEIEDGIQGNFVTRAARKEL